MIANKNIFSEHLNVLRFILDLYSTNYDHFILIGDFNTEFNEEFVKLFCESYNLKPHKRT